MLAINLKQLRLLVTQNSVVNLSRSDNLRAYSLEYIYDSRHIRWLYKSKDFATPSIIVG